MKTITETSTGLSKYLCEDSIDIQINERMIIVGNPAVLYIYELNSLNANLTENVTNAPSDWVPDKYTFDGTTWTLNADYTAPLEPYVIGDTQ